jgi:Caspase domain
MSDDPSSALQVKMNDAARRNRPRTWRSRLIVAGLAAFALAASAAVAQARSLALVIGNDSYANVVALRTAVGDARAVGDQLEKMGFIVRRALNVDQRAMSRALAAFDAELQPGDRALFFFSGHGFEISGANYLLPIDVPSAQANQVGIVRDAAFSVENVIDGVRKSGARLTVLVLDACRDNSFAAAGRTGGQAGGLARIDAPEGVFVLMSAGAKQEALDRLSDNDDERNSVFTRTFLVELAKPGRTLVQIAKATQVEVKSLAATIGYEQTPAYYDQVIGDVVLSDVAPDSPVASPALPALMARSSPAPARQQTAALAPDSKLAEALKVGGQAPIANFMRSNSGWTVTLSLPEPATAISYRVGDAGEFKSTGLTDALDQRTGQRAPNPSFPLSSRAGPTIIQVRYETADGGSVGPFPIRFDPEAALFREQKHILEQMPINWVEFRQFKGTLIYFTTLVTYRCAIAELRYGLDDGKPLQRYDLPGCNAKDPFAVPENARLYLKAPPQTKSISLQITWRDGTQSDVATIERD